jgi:hypothetical protein
MRNVFLWILGLCLKSFEISILRIMPEEFLKRAVELHEKIDTSSI